MVEPGSGNQDVSEYKAFLSPHMTVVPATKTGGGTGITWELGSNTNCQTLCQLATAEILRSLWQPGL